MLEFITEHWFITYLVIAVPTTFFVVRFVGFNRLGDDD